MYLCYVDESGDPGPHGSRFLVLGAAAIFEGRWRHVREDLERLIQLYFPSAATRPAEVHLADLRRGKGPFRGLTPAQRTGLVNDLCALANRCLQTELRFFALIADKPDWFSAHPGATGDDLYAELFEGLCSRFDLFLRRRHAEGAPSKGIIIADPHKPALSHTLQSNHGVFQRTGTRWGQVYNLIETLFFLASHESPGLQLADMCSYAVWRVLTASDTAIAQQVCSLFDREPLNSGHDPGKWHGIRYAGKDPVIRAAINKIWCQGS